MAHPTRPDPDPAGWPPTWIGWLGSPGGLGRVALASIVANIAIVLTGGAVRLTGSGLGCPTWPRCADDSYVATAEMGVHGAIEFGNRLITFVLVAIAVLGVLGALAQRPRRPRVTRLAVLVFLGIPAQATVGGATVLTGLNPWVVAGHFLVSMAVIAAGYAFWTAGREGDAPAVAAVPRPLRVLAGIIVGVAVTVLAAGTVVTGSGPHAGDVNARRTGFDPQAVAQLHADVVAVLLGLAVAMWFALRAVGARAAAVRAAWLVAVVVTQGVVGIVSYATDLPVLGVGLHLAGACAVWLATLALWYATRSRPRVPAHEPDHLDARGRPVLAAPPAGGPGVPGVADASQRPVY